MNKNLSSEYGDLSVFRDSTVADQYVAFVDILGFGSRIESDFEAAVEAYRLVFSPEPMDVGASFPDVKIRVMSDAFVLTCPNLASVIGAVNILHFKTLLNDCLIRGGIGYGKHVETENEDGNFVVSQGLVQAVGIEKTIRYPCVAIHEGIEIPPEWWAPGVNPFLRRLLFFEGVRLVNPFNVLWGLSAMMRVARMPRDNPKHIEKYDWFLQLYDAVKSGQPLVPAA